MPRANNAAFLRAAQDKRHNQMLERTLQAIEQMRANGERIAYTGLAAVAGVSRAWLYHQPEVQAAVDAARAEVRSQRRRSPGELASDASKDARIRLLLEDNQVLRAELVALKTTLTELLGELRELRQANGRH